MVHPNGGQGSRFPVNHLFLEAFSFVGKGGVTFRSTTGERIKARQGIAKDRRTPTIVFIGERSKQGSVCHACWGFRIDCNQSRVGQCAEALDASIP